ncbi:protein kinase, partial [Helicosporidium sp. ATCC 50920]
SRAVQARDVETGALVCLKVMRHGKDYFDQGLDEIKLLRYVNDADPDDEQGILRLLDSFYYKEHLVLVCELLRANLYEFLKHNRLSGDEKYFAGPRLASVCHQVLRSLAFLHSLRLIHADLKPENILVKSYSRCRVKVIDLGSSCFLSDRLAVYVQSRSYRAPEVVLGLPYDQRIDLWSLGCVAAELATGRVLMANESVPTLLARMHSILGPFPLAMLKKGRFAHKYFTKSGKIYERSAKTGRLEYLRPKQSSLAARLAGLDPEFVSFVHSVLHLDPAQRPTAAQALEHPWLEQRRALPGARSP